ncbi:hypothetical protein JGS39_05105 [Streptomyces sp. P01-B04]|uniref:hypothetical protein n=1 Tax=Streptomyces poriferorum TaxID=2798799 RepID=UPI001C5EDA38|nr:hypothetical protein [Streptomyces poriferorum]MBW5248408.1 hypothetical protein [Streptomyces poriferorum]MBW5256075.1 hypothetical protein [Streptomyces poriferorum]
MSHPPNEAQQAPALNPAAAITLADETLRLQLGTTTLPAMQVQVVLLVEQIRCFFEAGLPEDREEADAQRQEILPLLEEVLAGDDVAWRTWTRMRALGRVLRRHVAQYTDRRLGEGQEPREAPTVAPGSGGPRGTYRVPTVLEMRRAQQWLNRSAGGHQ